MGDTNNLHQNNAKIQEMIQEAFKNVRQSDILVTSRKKISKHSKLYNVCKYSKRSEKQFFTDPATFISSFSWFPVFTLFHFLPIILE